MDHEWVSRCISFWKFSGFSSNRHVSWLQGKRLNKKGGLIEPCAAIFRSSGPSSPPQNKLPPYYQAFGSDMGSLLGGSGVLCFGQIFPQDLMIQKDGFWSFIPSFLGCWDPPNKKGGNKIDFEFDLGQILFFKIVRFDSNPLLSRWWFPVMSWR